MPSFVEVERRSRPSLQAEEARVSGDSRARKGGGRRSPEKVS